MKHIDALSTSVSRETRKRLEIFVALLLRWNEKINLVARGDLPRLWDRHVSDSLALVPLLPGAAVAIADLGSGGGFPGLVVAIATGRHVHLVEADQRKCAFLREAARATDASVTIHPIRIEHCELRSVALLTARALAPLSRLLDWAAPLLAPDGVCLFPKGRGIDAELTAARTQWHMRVERFPSPTDPESSILRLSEITRVGPHA